MKLRMVCAALAGVALSAPAVAEPLSILRQDGSSTLLLAQAAPGVLPPYEILTIVRSTGLDPLGQPFRRGPHYVLRAIDDGDREVRVLISARTGDIVSVTPLAVASRTTPGGLTMGPYEPMPPDGYLPPERPGVYRGGPPVAYEDDDEPEPHAPRPPASVRGAPPSGVSAMPPPVIRATPPQGAYVPPPSGSRAVTRAPIRGAELPPPSEPNVIASTEPDVDGMLPPPPERFPQRAAPPSAAKPKPVKRAAASIPKHAPLPRPRPGTSVEASPVPQPAPEKKATPEPIPE